MGAAFGDRDWQAARSRLCSCSTYADLRDTIFDQANKMRSQVDQKPTASTSPRAFWNSLGVMISERDLDYSLGGHVETNGQRLIFVKKADHAWRKRFTIAHELAHLLLVDVRNRRETILPPEAEERLCDEFASQLLIPRQQLNALLGTDDRLTTKLILSLCKAFKVNIQPMLIALSAIDQFQKTCVFIASRRGHPKRPNEVDYRSDMAPIHPSVYIPKHKRLHSLGLGEIAIWSTGKAPGAVGTGRSAVKLHLWRRGEATGHGVGEALWEALMLPDSMVLIVLELSALRFLWNPRKA